MDALRARCGFLVIGAVALAGLALAGLGLIDQWLRYRDFLVDGIGFRDRFCALPFCDFSVFWHAGRLARGSAVWAVYDSARFFLATGQAPAAGLPFMYAPVTLLLVAVMGLPKLAAGYYAWTAASLGIGLVLLRRAGLGWGCIGAGLAGLPAFWCLYLGQFGVICGALLIFGLARIEMRPWVAGAALGCLCIKPQYALLIPAVAMAHGDWRVLAGGAGMVAGLAAAAGMVFGWQVWPAFFGPGQAAMSAVLTAPFGTGYEMGGASVFWLVRSLGAGCTLAGLVQGAAGLLAMAGAFVIWRRPDGDRTARLALTVLLALLATPYAYTDDLVAYSAVLPLLARRNTPLINAALALLWLAPALAVRFAQDAGFLPLPFCMALAAVIAWRRWSEAPYFAVFPQAPGLAVRL